MINFYQEWKDDKESDVPKKKAKGKYKCPLCHKRTNGLKDHMNGNHGKDSYKIMVQAEERLAELDRQRLISMMKEISKEA